MTKLTFSLFDITKKTLATIVKEPESTSLSSWPEILMAQHSELDNEIAMVKSLLNNDHCHLIQLDVRLKKLTKAVLVHLELEAQFLVPMLTKLSVLPAQKKYLNEGFNALVDICSATTAYFHTLKLSFGNGLVSHQQKQRTTYFLNEIKKRLNDEDYIYTQMTETGGNYAV